MDLEDAEWKLGLMHATDNGRNSSQAFCAYANIDFVEVDYAEDIDFKQNRIPIPEFKNQENPYRYSEEVYMTRFSTEYKRVRDAIVEGVNKFRADFLLTCVGILHPFHVLTHWAVSEIGYRTWYWADLPYANKQYGKLLLKKALLTDFSIVESYNPTKEQMLEKQRLFRKFYPTESISWDWPAMHENPEIWLEAKEDG
jgi:hypothetical protein